MNKRKIVITAVVTALALVLLGLWWFILHANRAPEVRSVDVVPVQVLSGGEALVSAVAVDPDGDALSYAFAAPAGAFTADHDRARWQAPSVDSVAGVPVTVVATDPSGLSDTGRTEAVVVPVGWRGVMRTILKDTAVVSGGDVALRTDDMTLPGDNVTFVFAATGGRFDTLADGSVRWVAPAVDRDTTFVITMTGTNEKGEKIIKTVVVRVSPGDVAGEPREGIRRGTPHAVRDSASAAGDTAVRTADTAGLDAVRPERTGSGSATGRVTEDSVPRPGKKTAESPDGTPAGDTAAAAGERREIPEGEKGITGTVRNTGGRLLPGVRIAVSGREALSGNDGAYALTDLPGEDTVTLTCTAAGFNVEKVEAVVPAAKTYVVDITMRMAPLAPPVGLEARTVPDTAFLAWGKVGARTMTGYAVYRSADEYAGYDRLNAKPLVFSRYADATAEDSVKYYYRVATVNRDNVEGELSEYVTAVVPIKQFAVNRMYDSPYPNPTGIAYDGYTIWSCDNKRSEIYKHDWDLKVVKTVESPGDLPTGLAWDGRYLWSCDFRDKYVYKHGKSMKVVAKFKGPGVNLTDLTWDGHNLWACNGQGQVFKLDDKCKVLRTYRSPHSLSTGLAWHEGHLWMSSIHTRKIYRLRITKRDLVVDDTYESPFLLSDGFACDGTYFWACGKVTRKMYKFSFK